MSVQEARIDYTVWSQSLLIRTGRCGPRHSFDRRGCWYCGVLSRLIDAASITYDLAVAEASIERIRRQVAYA